MKENKKILITGVSGFIGSSISEFYKEKKWKVTGLTIEQFSQEDVDVFFSDYSVNELSSIIDKENPDIIIHTAGSSSVANSISNPDEDFRGSVMVRKQNCEYIKQSEDIILI